MGKKFFVGIIVSLVLFLFSLTSSFAASAAAAPDYKEGKLIVRFKEPTAKQMRKLGRPMSRRAIRNVIANTILRGSSISRDFDSLAPGLSVVTLPKGRRVANVLARFDFSPAVIYAEPDYTRELLVQPNDPSYKAGLQWALDNTGQLGGTPGADINAPEAWDIKNDASKIIVAVLDTGMDVNHPDFNDVSGNNLWKDPTDPNIHGYDFAGADGNNLFDGDKDVTDHVGHGTHVAGIIGARGNNGRGIAGVCWKVQLMPLKIFADNGGGAHTTDELAAISFAITNKANVINASYGGYSYSSAEYNAISAAGQAGITFVAAAGNDSYSFAAFPADYGLPNIIAVMATNQYDQMTYYSNYGATSVDIGAPGGEMYSVDDPGGIISTLPGTQDTPDNYGYKQGTSMAAPHVTGAAAILLAIYPNLTPPQIKAILNSTVDPVLPGLCISNGRLNLYKAAKEVVPGRVKIVGNIADFNTIQSAINAAVDGNEIIADSNHTYHENIDFKGKNVKVRSGDVNHPADANVYPATTSISGLFNLNSDNPKPVVTINSKGILKGFTIRDGDDSGIRVDSNSPTITNCVITQNTTSGDGGGIFCHANADPNFSGCTISNNTSSGDGGGIYCTAASLPIIRNCTITGNGSTNGAGGGIFCDGGSDANIVDCNIINNTSSATGGGIYWKDSSPVISNSLISGNQSAWEGGGIYDDNSPATITDCNVSNNLSQWDGGGIYCTAGSVAVITNSTISGNVAYYDGGGVYCHNASPTIKNNLFVDNTVVSYDGGAVFCNAGSPSITNCTFVNNSGNAYDGAGGAIFLKTSSSPHVTDCIFKGNDGYAIYKNDSGSNPVITYCLFYNNPFGDYYDAVAKKAYNMSGIPNQLGGTGNIGGNPLFVPGRLGSFYLSSGAAGQILDANGNVGDGNSPAIDAGSNTAASLGMDIYSTRTDNVPDGGTVDIGFHYNDPNAVADIYKLTIIRTPTAGGTVTPASGNNYTQFAQVRLKATHAAGYQLKSWQGTDNDAATDPNGDVDPNNIVTMSRNKTVRVTFETIEVELRTRVIGGNGTVVPRNGSYARGTVVTLTATPTDLSNIIRWSGTDNDNSISRTNQVTIDGPNARFVNGVQVVDVTFYAPRTLHVPGDYTNIQRAIDDANSGDIVLISPGSYNITPTGNEQNGAGLLITKDITIISTTPDDPCGTILRGGWMAFSGVGRDCVMTGLTIQDSRWYILPGCDGKVAPCPADVADGADGGGGAGGAIHLYNASPTFRNCIIKDNSITGGNGGNGACPDGDGGWGGWARGGAVYIQGDPLFVHCRFQNCYVRGGDGGNGCLTPPGGGHGGSWGPEDDPRWYYGPYLPYWKYSAYGGAVYCETGSTPEFVDCNFVDNHTYGSSCGKSVGPAGNGWPQQHLRIDSFGGAVYCASQSSPKFTGCNFSGNEPNTARYWHDDPANAIDMAQVDNYLTYGGAIAYEDDATPTFEKCTFNGNSANVGGAVYGEWGDARFGDCNVVANTGALGGGMYFVGGTNRVARSVITLNQAVFIDPNFADTPTEGGGIYIFDANTMVTDCNINGNTSTSGGGIYIAGSNMPLIKNCLIFGNSADRDGGGISANWYSHPTISNSTIADNSVSGSGFAVGYGGGMYVSYGSYAQIINSIIWGNSDATGKSGQITIGTGFEYDRRPADVNVSYSDVQGSAGGVYFDPGVSVSKLHWDYSSNLTGVDPRFVQGYYYLSQPATGDKTQTVLSPCVNKGKGNMTTDSNTLHLYRGTTRTDRVIDTGTVDMGYHYLRYADIVGDYNFDGEVNSVDLALFMQRWLYTGCDFPYWCDDRDLNQDGKVDNFDRAIFNLNNGKVETTPPNPNPMTWEILPYLATATSVKMRATKAVDNSGFPVQYYFERTDANGVYDGTYRGWSADANCSDTITAGGTYGYRVKVRDVKSANPNDPNNAETAWSLIAFAAVSGGGGSDKIAPKPNPMTWATVPYGYSGTEIRMIATTASDASGVEYQFERNGVALAWQSSPKYNNTGLDPNRTCSYRVRARDKSANHNMTNWSSLKSASTGAVVDKTPPSPDPLRWLIFPYEINGSDPNIGIISHFHTMACIAATDVSTPILYKFVCVDYPTISSGWQTSTTYTVNVGSTHYYRWYVIAEDALGNTTGSGNMVWVIR